MRIIHFIHSIWPISFEALVSNKMGQKCFDSKIIRIYFEFILRYLKFFSENAQAIFQYFDQAGICDLTFEYSSNGIIYT